MTKLQAKTPAPQLIDKNLSRSVRCLDGHAVAAADPRAVRALIALMDMHAVLGGAAAHFGGPSAFADLMSATWALIFDSKNTEWSEAFHVINDVGHCENALYAIKALYHQAGVTFDELKTFRSLESRLTGHGEVHAFPDGVYLSNGPLGSALPQAQGLAMADKLKNHSRTTVVFVSDGGLMEGEAREALAAIPGFARAGRMNPFVMVLSDNNTKLSGRIDTDAFSMEPTFATLETLGWNVISLTQGNDLQECIKALETAFQKAAAAPQKPVALHAKTIKGFGIQACVNAASGGHGFPLKSVKDLRAFLTEIYANEAVPEVFLNWTAELEKTASKNASSLAHAGSADTKEKIQVGVAKALIAQRTKGVPVVSISADLGGSTGVMDFRKKFPEASFDVGVAEANMVSVAAGFSKEGFVPVVDTFAQFGATKGALPLTMAALSDAPVLAIFSHTGFQDAADGASHQALSYLAQLGSIPNTRTYALTCSEEAEALVTQAIETFQAMRARQEVPPNFVFFLGREDFSKKISGGPYQLGKAQVLKQTSNPAVTIVAAGSLVGEALKAADELAEKKIGAIVINPSCLNQPDVDTLRAALSKTHGNLVTVEDHQVCGGLASFLLPVLLEKGVVVNHLRCIGVRNQFGRSAYTAPDLYRQYGMNAAAIVAAVQDIKNT
jgi:transketolase